MAERRLAAIMFTDIVGYTALMAESEEKGLGVRERHRALVRPLVQRYHGESIEARGDESLSTFPTALDAVNCALAIEAAARADAELKLHVGIHLGDVVVQDGEVSGDGVNIASRICALSEGGGICVSDEVQHSIQNQDNVQARSLGDHELKNVPRLVGVFSIMGAAAPPRSIAAVQPARRAGTGRWVSAGAAALVLVALGAWWLTGRAPDSGPIRSIAVLPLENLSGDPDQEYFADGMTEALITELAQIKSVQVRGRTTIMRYKGTDKSIPEIARELDVDGIIEGSVLRDGGEVRITAQLIHGSSDTHHWAGSFDSTVTSVLKLHREVALAIAQEINANLTPQERTLVEDSKDVNPLAYEQILLGNFWSSQQSPEGYARAGAHYGRAAKLDPNYSIAYARLASNSLAAASLGWADPRERVEEAREAVNRAFALDPNNAAAHRSAGWIALTYDYDWTAAERHFRRAQELDPEGSLHGIARLMSVRGEHESAIATAEKAVTMDPYDAGVLDALGDAYAMAGRLEEAVAVRTRVLELEPNHVGTWSNLVLEYLYLGRYQEAEAVRQKLTTREPRDLNAWDATTLLGLGREEEFHALLRELESRRDEQYLRPYDFAMAYAAIGDADKLFEELEKTYEERNFMLIWLNTPFSSPILEPYRDDPRLQNFLLRMNYPGPREND